jgi:GDP-mannose 6-dehydrogenase
MGIDRDQHKVYNVLAGRASFYEPGLEHLVRENVAQRRLCASTSADGIADAAVVMVCVGTPSKRNGNLALSQLRRAIEEIAAPISERSKPLIVAIRSTVLPSTSEEVVLPALAGHKQVSVVSNPEFLREGSAVKDFMEPSLVVGGSQPAAVQQVADLYAPHGSLEPSAFEGATHS